MATIFPLKKFEQIETPFYYYDTKLLRETIDAINNELKFYPKYKIHYAIKANANPALLNIISNAGFGADCVSGGEIELALKAGIPNSKILFAGVGKTDAEINFALDKGISAFNVESFEELEIINELSQKKGTIANIAIRFNPDIKAHTIDNIATGQKENKFGIAIDRVNEVICYLKKLKHIKFKGIHIHIGSQILEMNDFIELSKTVNGLIKIFENNAITITDVNVGGGLGVNYSDPKFGRIPDFKSYFDIFKKNLILTDYQNLHFELGRSIVAQCGSLISRVIYVKKELGKDFIILDAGMNDLIRPAMYKAFHKIENISSPFEAKIYDVVGPVCESSDVFGKDILLNQTKRGDLIAIRTTGAYGETMASTYNMRKIPKAYTDTDL